MKFGSTNLDSVVPNSLVGVPSGAVLDAKSTEDVVAVGVAESFGVGTGSVVGISGAMDSTDVVGADVEDDSGEGEGEGEDSGSGVGSGDGEGSGGGVGSGDGVELFSSAELEAAADVGSESPLLTDSVANGESSMDERQAGPEPKHTPDDVPQTG